MAEIATSSAYCQLPSPFASTVQSTKQNKMTDKCKLKILCVQTHLLLDTEFGGNFSCSLLFLTPFSQAGDRIACIANSHIFIRLDNYASACNFGVISDKSALH